jgi:hypothetical protein
VIKVNKYVKNLTALTVIALASTAIVFASVIIWRWTTKITVKEPFEITTTLPTEATLYPGNYSYTISITNHASKDYNATLKWSITNSTNCSVEISPPNGTSYKVPLMSTITIPVTISITLNTGATNGTAIIDWWIERS